MANEVKIIYATTINHISNGASVANGAMSATETDVALSSTNLLDYPLANIILTFTASAAPTEGDYIQLFRRDMNVAGGAADMPIPTTAFENVFMGSFFVSESASEQVLQLSGVPLVEECEFYIRNRLDGTISINNTWDIQIQPYTYGTA